MHANKNVSTLVAENSVTGRNTVRSSSNFCGVSLNLVSLQKFDAILGGGYSSGFTCRGGGVAFKSSVSALQSIEVKRGSTNYSA